MTIHIPDFWVGWFAGCFFQAVGTIALTALVKAMKP